MLKLAKISNNNRGIAARFTHIFPAPVGVQKNPRFLRKFQICGLITLLLDIVCLARGVSGGVFSPFLVKNRQFRSHFAARIWGLFWGGQKVAKNGQKWQKWPKWAKMAKNGLFRGSLGKPPPPPFLRFKSCLKTPVFAKRAIFQDFWGGRFWGGVKKGRFWGFLGFSGGVKKGSKSDPKRGVQNGQNGQKVGFWGVSWGGRKWPLLGFPDEIPD